MQRTRAHNERSRERIRPVLVRTAIAMAALAGGAGIALAFPLVHAAVALLLALIAATQTPGVAERIRWNHRQHGGRVDAFGAGLNALLAVASLLAPIPLPLRIYRFGIASCFAIFLALDEYRLPRRPFWRGFTLYFAVPLISLSVTFGVDLPAFVTAFKVPIDAYITGIDHTGIVPPPLREVFISQGYPNQPDGQVVLDPFGRDRAHLLANEPTETIVALISATPAAIFDRTRCAWYRALNPTAPITGYAIDPDPIRRIAGCVLIASDDPTARARAQTRLTENLAPVPIPIRALRACSVTTARVWFLLGNAARASGDNYAGHERVADYLLAEARRENPLPLRYLADSPSLGLFRPCYERARTHHARA
jgi:hypothetical protein